MKILMIGPFPDPVHGMSLANQMIYEHFSSCDDIVVERHDTNLSKRIKEKSSQGKFSFIYFFYALSNTCSCLYKLFLSNHNVIYVTPGQSVLGLLRFLPIVFISKFSSKKCFLHIHGSKLRSNIERSNLILRKICLLLLKTSTKVIFLGESIQKSHCNIVSPSKSVICYNGVPLPSIVPKKGTHKGLNVLFLSNLMVDKGVLDLFDAIGLMIGKYDINFDFAGEIENGLEEFADGFFNEHKAFTKYHGVVSGDEKANLLRKADVLILPSYDEGQPLCILEAYSYGCAVVTTDVGGISDIFVNGRNGLYCNVANPSSIKNSLVSILHTGVEKYSEANIYDAKEKYSLSVFFYNLKALLGGVDV